MVNRRATIRDVAEAAGVSIGTISRALNEPERVKGATLAKITQAIKQLDYRVDTVAQSLRAGSTHVVALLVHDISNPIFIAAARAAQLVLNRANYLLVLASTDPSQHSDETLIKMLAQRRMDGLIAFVRREDDEAANAALRAFEGPIILFDRQIDVVADVVLTDHAEGMKRLTRHLLGLGHRRIALITGAPLIFPGRERRRGFVEAFRSMGLEPPMHLVRDDSLEMQYGLREASAFLHSDEPPTAIIAGGNQVLEGVVGAIQGNGLSIPHDISVGGFDDSPLARLASPPITVVRRDVAQMGAIAAEILVQRLKEGRLEKTRRVVLPTELVLRESCGQPRSRP
jgi:LacI family transcriptional regulator